MSNKKWFDGSAIVNDAGRPLRVYQSTETGKSYSGRDSLIFTDNPTNAECRIRHGKVIGAIAPAYLNIKSPKIIRHSIECAMLEKTKSIIDDAKRDGYDGVIFVSQKVLPGEDEVITIRDIRPFKSSQVCSAFCNSNELYHLGLSEIKPDSYEIYLDQIGVVEDEEEFFSAFIDESK